MDPATLYYVPQKAIISTGTKNKPITKNFIAIDWASIGDVHVATAVVIHYNYQEFGSRPKRQPVVPIPKPADPAPAPVPKPIPQLKTGISFKDMASKPAIPVKPSAPKSPTKAAQPIKVEKKAPITSPLKMPTVPKPVIYSADLTYKLAPEELDLFNARCGENPMHNTEHIISEVFDYFTKLPIWGVTKIFIPTAFEKIKETITSLKEEIDLPKKLYWCRVYDFINGKSDTIDVLTSDKPMLQRWIYRKYLKIHTENLQFTFYEHRDIHYIIPYCWTATYKGKEYRFDYDDSMMITVKLKRGNFNVKSDGYSWGAPYMAECQVAGYKSYLDDTLYDIHQSMVDSYEAYDNWWRDCEYGTD